VKRWAGVLVVVAGLTCSGLAWAAAVERIDYTGTVEVHNCTQEPLLMRGHITVVTREATDASGANHTIFQFVFQGLKATSLETGVEYVLTGTTTAVVREGGSGADVIASTGSRLQFAHGQDGVDLLHNVVVHFLVTPNGDQVATFEHGRLECRGGDDAAAG
jgi:hypothetical protein